MKPKKNNRGRKPNHFDERRKVFYPKRQGNGVEPREEKQVAELNLQSGG